MQHEKYLYTKFILIVQAKTMVDALLIAGANRLLQKIVFYLEQEYQLYEKNTN